MSAGYKEFEWFSAEPGNGNAGAGLARTFVRITSQLDGVKKICDLGSGNGYLAGSLAKAGYDVTGVDASESGIQISRRNYPMVNFVHSDFAAALEHVGPGKFDLVISSDVIEHLYRPSLLLEVASSVLGPDGKILIGAPYHGYLKNLLLSVSGRMENHFGALDDGGHIKFFSVRTLSALIVQNGFKDPQFSFYGRAPWLWMNMICLAQKGRSQ